MQKEKYDVIIFFTATYPFGNGETFIENEINFLRDSCDHLIIVPFSECQYGKSRLQKDEAVEIIELQDSWREWMIAAVKTIGSKEIWVELIERLRSHRGFLGFLYDLLGLIYFSIKSRVRFFQILPLIRKWAHTKNKLVYSYWAGTQAYVAQNIKKYERSFIIVTRAHGYDLYQERKIRLPFRKKTFQAMDGIYPVSENGRKYLVACFPELEGKTFVFRLGTNDYGFSLNASKQSFYIVSCSSMIPLKRIHLIIDALSRTELEINWTHYGNGPLREELEQKAKELPTNIRWIFRGEIENQDLMQEYSARKIDLFLNVSETEGIPVAIMEAISFGIPVIATQVGGTPEIVKDGVNGFLLPVDISGEGLKNSIEEFWRLSQKEKDEMRFNSRRIWEKNFYMNNNYEQFYQELMKFVK